MTNLEQKTWKILESLGYELKFYSDKLPVSVYPANTIFAQYRIHACPKVHLVDFALPKAKIAIEIDGRYWHSDILQKAQDEERDNKLRKLGWKVIRLPENLIDQQHIQQAIYQLLDV